MKNNWKDLFKKKFSPIYSGDMSGGYDAMPYLLEFVENLLAEQKAETLEKALEWFGHYENGDFVYDHEPGSVKEIVTKALAEQKKELMEEIEDGIRNYKVPKELKSNTLNADYIFVYDLNTFVLKNINHHD